MKINTEKKTPHKINANFRRIRNIFFHVNLSSWKFLLEAIAPLNEIKLIPHNNSLFAYAFFSHFNIFDRKNFHEIRNLQTKNTDNN